MLVQGDELHITKKKSLGNVAKFELKKTEETANIGYKLALAVVEWYSEESIEFLKTNFD